MGLKGKFLFMLIVYFSGFATAVYYLSPDGRLAAANASESRSYDSSQSKATAALTGLRDSAREKIAGMDKQDFKDAYYRAVEAIKRMANKTGRGSEVSQDSQVSDGGEDK